ncbi:hypothetical protein B0H63DRAFT_420484 [Podospora didyma]|uniref:BTB domain-containing protein n=1 Tax=Podospora didyma TaxID=330526 RepID=A0AAE0N610_9PEZI|nr:hypothetical protein B0H63DRAFT_420484 [Podospora didyma]
MIRKHELEAKLKEDSTLIRSGVLRNEHPVDPSQAFADFMQACRKGNLKECQELITLGVNINGKDRFDYTPLVIASLCGHYEVVRLLLESGALADPDSFERERAVYNALNNRIRNLLLSYDYTKTADPLQVWASHITSLLTRDHPKTSDITLTADTETFHVHKFVLSARSPYFRRKFAEAPETTTWKLSHAIPVEAFRIVLKYLYLGDLPRDLVAPESGVSEKDVLKGIDKLCKQLELDMLWEAVMAMTDRRLARQRQQDEVKRAQKQVEDFFEETVVKFRMDVDTRKLADVKWPRDNAIFANCLLRADEDEGDEEEGDTVSNHLGIPIESAGSKTSSGIGKPKRSVLYPAHKPFLIRCLYFETMFSSEFKEALDGEHLHIIKVDCTPEVLEIILRFLYTEKTECPLEFSLDLLYVSDMLLLDKLKQAAAVTISTLGSGTRNALVDRTHFGPKRLPKQQARDGEAEDVEPINVYDVIRAAWDLGVMRLEEFAAQYLASRLEDFIDDDDFVDLIRESASRIKERQETDTIELLDDIRFYLSERFRLRFDGDGIEDLLDDTSEEEADPESNNENGSSGPGDIAEDERTPSPTGDGVTTLDGKVVEDEFSSDAVNYDVLIGKIDMMLEKIGLDA